MAILVTPSVTDRVAPTTLWRLSPQLVSDDAINCAACLVQRARHGGDNAAAFHIREPTRAGKENDRTADFDPICIKRSLCCVRALDLIAIRRRQRECAVDGNCGAARDAPRARIEVAQFC